MNRSLFVLVFLLAAVLGSSAQQRDTTAYAFSLQQAIQYAFENHPSVLNAEIDEQISKARVRETVGIGLPQINGNFSFQDFLKVPTSLLPGEFFGQPGTQIPVKFGVKYQSSAGLDVSQLVFDGSYLVGLQASKTFRELSTIASRRTRNETAVAVTKAYYSVLVSNEQLALLDANLTRLRKTLRDTEAFYKNGFVEKVDVDRLRVITNNLETERQNVVRLLDLNVNLLKFQMGMPITAKLTLTDKIQEIERAELGLNEGAYRNRAEYALLETQKRLNELDLKRYKSQFLPSLVAFASTSQSFQNNNFGDLYDRGFPTAVVGLRLNVPIYSGGMKTQRVKIAEFEVRKSENNLSQLRNAIDLEISQAQTTYANGYESLENQRRNIELAREVVRVSRIKYEQGVGSSLEVTTAETALKEAENNYIQALYELLINRVNLDKALGRINY